MHVQPILIHLVFKKSYMLRLLYTMHPLKFVVLESKNALFGRRTDNIQVNGDLGKLVYFGDNLSLKKSKKPHHASMWARHRV